MFKTKQEINDYFSGEKIECLICGKEFKTLGSHLRRVHDVSVDDYKIKFGLPFSRGLTSDGSRSKMSAHMKRRISEGDPTLMDISKVGHIGQQTINRIQPFTVKQKSDIFTTYNVEIKKIKRYRIEAVLSYMEHNSIRFGSVAFSLFGMSGGSFSCRVKDFKDLSDRYNILKKIVPVNDLGFCGKNRTEIKKITIKYREEKYTIEQIASQMNIGKTTVRRILNSDGAWDF